MSVQFASASNLQLAQPIRREIVTDEQIYYILAF